MKKLMLTAAAVAMAGVASAATQVYDIKFNLKTTTCKTTNIAANQNPFRLAAGAIEYRTQGSLAVQGLIWSCGCDYLVDLGVAVDVAGAASSWKYYVWSDGAAYDPAAAAPREGYIFWNAKTKAPWGYATINKVASATDMTLWVPTAGQAMPTFQWDFLQRFGARAEKVEGAWTLTDQFSGVNKYSLAGAGFGSNKQFGSIANVIAPKVSAGNGVTYPAPGGAANWDEECNDAIISSMSGNLAGYIDAADNGCVFCGGQTCPAYVFCRCYVDKFDANKTAAYGTWTLKYNAGLSTKLPAVESIRNIYKFSDATAEYVAWLEANAQ